MKIHVITDAKGDIVATVHATPGPRGDMPIGRPLPLDGQRVHEIELPQELEGHRDADSLHSGLRPLIK